jgi:hypothetical protein
MYRIEASTVVERSVPISEDRTRLTRRLELEPHGRIALLAPALAFLARRERRAGISNLKRILESTAVELGSA